MSLEKPSQPEHEEKPKVVVHGRVERIARAIDTLNKSEEFTKGTREVARVAGYVGVSSALAAPYIEALNQDKALYVISTLLVSYVLLRATGKPKTIG